MMYKIIWLCFALLSVSCANLTAPNHQSPSTQSLSPTSAEPAETSFGEKMTSWFDNSFKSKSKSNPVAKIKKPIDINNTDVAYVVVNKGERKMYLKLSDGQVIRQYDIGLGAEPIGKKQFEGDLKTPEGLYRLGFKNADSKFYKSIHISYPNLMDEKTANAQNKSPGKNIMIHGLPNKWQKDALFKVRGKDWTEGCISLSDTDMEEFWFLIKEPGTFIKINP